MNPLSIVSGRVLLGTALLGLLGVYSVIKGPEADNPVKIELTPLVGTITLGEEFTVLLEVESTIPVNAFSGEIGFADDSLEVRAIRYNTSIADLWVEEPWYSAGAGSIKFAGGTTKPGGFIGRGHLLSVTFKAAKAGRHTVSLKGARVFKHDGLGTEALVDQPLDALFTTEAIKNQATTFTNTETKKSVNVIPTGMTYDLNGDGKVGLADTSIFMIKMATYDSKRDFNQDGKVDLKDLNLLLSQ